MFSKIFQFSLFQCQRCFCPSNISISSIFYLGKATFHFSRENQWFCLFTHKQAFAAGVRRTYTIPTCGAQRPVADDFALQLHWCDAERTTAKTPICAGTCWYKRGFLNFFFCQSRRAFLKALLLCLFGGERQGFVVRPSPLRHRCRS